MKYFFSLCCLVVILTLSVPVESAMPQYMPLHATAQDYIDVYNGAALEYALRQGNHNVIADLLEMNQIQNIEIGCICTILAMQELEDLHDLFSALHLKTISMSEFIQVLRVFKATPRRVVNEYGDLEQLSRVCHGNGALDFAQLPQDLAIKVASILGLK
ncbi:hypothetical protein JST56_02290 [Candidatus Dependentiae bacterium]|nr:hypothetical protein [Candidatus Dependentiae bacterium]